MNPTDCRRASVRWSLCVLLLLALILRCLDLPFRYEMRHVDERPYTQSGLAMWEGITPTYKYSPAGPQVWISWLYAAAESARYLLLSGPEEHAAPLVLRPFVAVNHALFDVYRDWSRLREIQIAANMIVVLGAVAAGFCLGMRRGGLAAAILVGGLMAAVPLMVRLTDESRPYAMGWSLGLIALCFAAAGNSLASAIAMGLAVGTRIDMLLLLPLAWGDLWINGSRRLVRYTLIAAMCSVLVAPWLLTNLLGNLRTIATVRVAEPTSGPQPLSGTILQVTVFQGLGIPLLLVLVGAFLPVASGKRPRWVMGIYVLFLATTILKATGFGLQHQGGPIIAIIAFSSIGLAAIATRIPKLACALAALALVMPIAHSAMQIHYDRTNYDAGHAAAWIERHVPPGTIVYLSPQLHDPLPTLAASNALWDEVMAPAAWERKMESAMTRFHSSASELPRALSEENMIIERGLRREWFILGSRQNIPDPRYDIRIFCNSVVFGVPDVSAAFKQTGGVVVCDDRMGEMPKDLGEPVVGWMGTDGGVRIYCSPDVVAKLQDTGDLQGW